MAIIDNTRYSIKISEYANNAQYIVAENSYDERINYFVEDDHLNNERTCTLTNDVLSKNA